MVIKMEKVNQLFELDSSIHRLLHEIKNPLTVVSGYLELMGEGKNNEKFYKIIEEEVNRTLSIISNYSSNQTLEKEEIELACFMEEMKASLEELYLQNNTNIILLGKEEIYLCTNYLKIKQIVTNIIKNSYEARKNHLDITIDWYEEKENLKIIISDNGIGMTKEELSHIEEEYYTTKEYGTGLGIPLIKEMMKQLNGKMEITSKKNIGTEVTLIFQKEKNSEEF